MGTWAHILHNVEGTESNRNSGLLIFSLQGQNCAIVGEKEVKCSIPVHKCCSSKKYLDNIEISAKNG